MKIKKAPEESYSRRIDLEVKATEMPYGYDNTPHMAEYDLVHTGQYDRMEEKSGLERKFEKG